MKGCPHFLHANDLGSDSDIPNGSGVSDMKFLCMFWVRLAGVGRC